VEDGLLLTMAGVTIADHGRRDHLIELFPHDPYALQARYGRRRDSPTAAKGCQEGPRVTTEHRWARGGALAPRTPGRRS
jgi:hypothetical protein